MKEWPKIIRQLQAERRVSQRELARRTGIDRKTICFALLDRRNLTIDRLESILATFGYHLTAVSHDGEKLICRSFLPASVAGKSSPPGNAAHAKPSTKESAKPASTKHAHPPANGDTTANGTKSGLHISPPTGAA